MMVNVYDTANELERQIRETQEYKRLEEAFDVLRTDKAAADLFVKFQRKQAAAQKKQLDGQEISDDEVKEMETLAKEVTDKAAIKVLMEREQDIDKMIQRLNQIITGPIQDLYKQFTPE